jgi:hypothetical protein
MGLIERRALAEFQERNYPGLLKKVQDAAGFSVPVEVKWDTLALDGQSDKYVKYWPDVYFTPLAAGLARVAKDEIGRGALKAGLKKIVIENDSDNKRPDRWADLKDGVLTLDHHPFFNLEDRQLRANALGDLLEKKL